MSVNLIHLCLKVNGASYNQVYLITKKNDNSVHPGHVFFFALVTEFCSAMQKYSTLHAILLYFGKHYLFASKLQKKL